MTHPLASTFQVTKVYHHEVLGIKPGALQTIDKYSTNDLLLTVFYTVALIPFPINFVGFTLQ